MRSIDRSAQTNRWRHHAASEKVLLALGLMVISLSIHNLGAQVILLILASVLTMAVAKVSPRDVLAAGLVPLGFILTGTAAQLLVLDFSGSRSWLSLAGPEGFRAAAFVAARSLACVSALLLLALTTPLASILQLLQRIGLNADLSDIAMIMIRMIWLTLDCLETGHRSIVSRLGHARMGRMLRSNAMLGASLLPRVMSRAGRMEIGLAARGYDGHLRFLSAERRSTWPRLALILGGLLLLAVLLGTLP